MQFTKIESGVLSFRKPRGRKLTFMMAAGGTENSGVEFIRRDQPVGAYVYCWCDHDTGERREFSIVPDYETFGIDRPARRAPSRVEPHPLFRCWRADEVAECIAGVTPELYRKLWDNIIESKPTPGLDYREIPDDFGDTNLSKRWSKFTREEQLELNRLATAHEEEERASLERYKAAKGSR